MTPFIDSLPYFSPMFRKNRTENSIFPDGIFPWRNISGGKGILYEDETEFRCVIKKIISNSIKKSCFNGKYGATLKLETNRNYQVYEWYCPLINTLLFTQFLFLELWKMLIILIKRPLCFRSHS